MSSYPKGHPLTGFNHVIDELRGHNTSLQQQLKTAQQDLALAMQGKPDGALIEKVFALVQSQLKTYEVYTTEHLRALGEMIQREAEAGVELRIQDAVAAAVKPLQDKLVSLNGQRIKLAEKEANLIVQEADHLADKREHYGEQLRIYRELEEAKAEIRTLKKVLTEKNLFQKLLTRFF